MQIKLFVSAAAIALALGLGPATAGEDLTIHAGLSSPEATESQPQAGTFQAMQGIAAEALTTAEKDAVRGRNPGHMGQFYAHFYHVLPHPSATHSHD